MDWDWPLSLSGRDDWVDFSAPASGRSADPLSPFFVDPRVTSITDRHPTLVDCARRELERVEWDRAMLRYEKDRRCHTALEGVPLPLFVAAVALLIAGQAVAAAVCALAVVAAVVWVAVRVRVPDPGLPPPPLRLRPFGEDENRLLARLVEPTPFRPVCACPGCGLLSLHPLISGDARPVRKCLTCNREWVQS